jgi:hypothetical protein
MMLIRVLLGLAAVASGMPAAADVVDTFDNNVNQGTWRLTNNPNRLYRIETSGGNPGAYLHGQVATAVPTWYIDQPVGNPFTGDFAAAGFRSFRFDLTISGGIQVPDRVLTFHLFTTLGTGDPTQGIDAYHLGEDISNYMPGWNTYAYPLDAASPTIPAGWHVTEGNGSPGTDADWRSLMTHIEDVHMELGQPGYAYPNLGVWDLGLDNVTLSTSPLPAPGSLLVLAGAPLLTRRRRVSGPAR